MVALRDGFTVARAHHGVMVALWDGGMCALRDIVLIAASRTGRARRGKTGILAIIFVDCADL